MASTRYLSYSLAWTELVTSWVDADRAHGVLAEADRKGMSTVTGGTGTTLTVTSTEDGRYQVTEEAGD